MTPLSPGSTVSHYRILETLGRGGQATAFEGEACLCSALDNPHIQGVYDVGETDGLYYIVLQYIEGPTLKQLLAGRPLEPLSALSIAIQIADALAVAHACGIAHRDLKPANVIVTADGQAKVLDFGLAKMLAADAVAEEGSPARSPTDEPLTEVGVPYGSMGYSSPEQAAGDPADHSTDVFSL